MPTISELVLENKCNKLEFQAERLRKKFNTKNGKIFRLKRKASRKNSALHQSLHYKNKSISTFVKMQLFHKSQAAWTMNEKQMAISLFYKSPSNYRFMRQKFKFVLPSVRTIQSWLHVIRFKTGMETTLTEKLFYKAKTMTPFEKTCVVTFDEISVKRKLDYNRTEDFIEGFEDFGPFGRTDQPANSALVFMIRGMFSNWKMPVCYFTSYGPMKAPMLKNIIKYVLESLKKLTFVPKFLVCDQGSNNRAVYKLLGVTKDNPAVTIADEKIFTSFDGPHLLKSLRNNFCNDASLKFHISDQLVRWQDIVDTYKVDSKSEVARSMIKITTVHLNPTSFQKMRVKYAAQIFSKSVAAAILTAHATNELKSSTALETAKFLITINDIFDALNSRVLNDANPIRSAISVFNEKPLQVLKNAVQFFDSIKVYRNNKLANNIYCISGFQWTINSILMLWEDLQKENCKFLLTNFLNQDCLENCFSVVRSRGGYNPTPSIKQMRIALQNIINIRLPMAVDSGNCEFDDNVENLDISDDINHKTSKASTSSVSPGSIAADFKNCEIDENLENLNESSKVPMMTSSKTTAPEINNLEICSVAYIAGYVSYKLIKDTDCENCKKDFLKRDDNPDLIDRNEMLILFRDYSAEGSIKYLQRPKATLVTLVNNILNTFNESFSAHKSELNIAKQIKSDIKNFLMTKTDFFTSECRNTIHKEKFVDIIIKMKLFRNCKWESERFTSSSCSAVKPHRKVKILSQK